MAVVLKGQTPNKTVRLFTCKTFKKRLADYARMEHEEAKAAKQQVVGRRYEPEIEPDES